MFVLVNYMILNLLYACYISINVVIIVAVLHSLTTLNNGNKIDYLLDNMKRGSFQVYHT